MRILLMNQFFWPDSSATSQLLTDLAQQMRSEGHEVYAICSEGGYAVADSGDAPDVTVQRVKSLPFVRGSLGRMMSYLSFYVGAAFWSMALPKPDVVVTLTTPPLLSVLGTLVKKLRGARHFIWEMDMYPDVAVDLEYFKPGSAVVRVTGAIADYSRGCADGIIALGECMKERLMRRGVTGSKIFVAENWADGRGIKPMRRTAQHGPLALLYSGNLGLAHDLDTIQAVMLALKHDERFAFRFVGSGGRRDELKEFCSRHAIGSLELLPYVQRANLSESFAAGDIGLVTQRMECCGSVVPSKVYGLLAAERPILFIGPREATPARIIERFRCGWHVECGEVEKLTQLLLHLAEDRAEVQLAGKRARQAFLEHYDLPLGVARIARILDPDKETGATQHAQRAAA